MPSWWRLLRASLSSSFLAALVLAGGFFALVAWDQAHWWRLKSDYTFGWLAPLFALYVVYDRWPVIRARLAACVVEESPRASGFARWVLAGAAGLAILVGAFLVLFGALYRARNGAAPPATFVITLGSIAFVTALLFLSAPGSPRPAPSRLLADARLRVLACFVFPLLVWLVSAPLVSVIESQVNLLLLGGIVRIVAFVFEVLGFAIEQQGNVLELPTGRVGVEEACSGIRSLTAFIFAGSFLAAIFVDRLGKKIALVSAAVALGLIANLGRSLFLTAWAYRHGGEISDAVHDAAGYAVLAIAVGGLIAMLRPWRSAVPAARATPD